MPPSASEDVHTLIKLLHAPFRWAFAVFFLLPVSACYDALFYLRAKLVFYLRSAPAKHNGMRWRRDTAPVRMVR